MIKNIAVIGESCVDEYVYGTCDRVCPEAAALCFKHDSIKTTNMGMAGNTFNNIKTLNKESNIDLITTQSQIIKRRFVDKRYNAIIFREDINDTTGENGANFYPKGNPTFTNYPTHKIELRDVCGAGDTFLAALVTEYMRSFDIVKSIIYANDCSSKVVSQFGVVTP